MREESETDFSAEVVWSTRLGAIVAVNGEDEAYKEGLGLDDSQAPNIEARFANSSNEDTSTKISIHGRTTQEDLNRTESRSLSYMNSATRTLAAVLYDGDRRKHETPRFIDRPHEARIGV